MLGIVEYFGFTKAEAEVTELLCQRQSIEEVATTLNASLHTVRQQVKACIQSPVPQSGGVGEHGGDGLNGLGLFQD